ncbi:MAG: hypothetical protein QXT58_01580 [Archaeoglobaceae archaeon]
MSLASEVFEILNELYSHENLNNKSDPTDEYFFIVLSTKTSHKIYEKTFENLKKAVANDWNNVLIMSEIEIREIIRPCGLYQLKSKWIKKAAEMMREDFGLVTLEPLKTLSDEDAENYLLSLPGIGVKSAKAIMMYSLGKQVLPVDTHTYRLAARLGLITPTLVLRNEKEIEKAHSILEPLIPPIYRKAFHVGAVILGRTVCTPRNPRHDACPLKTYCPLALGGNSFATGSPLSNAL